MLQWLVNQYYYLRDRISALWNNAYYWANQKAESAYNRAVAWANDKINRARTLAWDLYYSAKSHATNLLSNVTSTILYWYNRAVAGAQALVNGVRDLARALYNNGLAYAVYQYNRAVAAAQAIVQGAKDLANALYRKALTKINEGFDRAVATASALVNGVRDVFNALIDRGKVELAEFKAKIGVDEPAKQGRLLQFLQSPGSFILAYVWDMFLIMLEWALAYALGTTEDELPPLPNFFEEGSGGAILVGTGPPPGASGLASPLDNVRVSGYTFRPGHPGIDLGLMRGTPVYAMHSGEVLIAGWSNVGYGFQVVINGGDWWTRYGHCEALNVRAGDRVKQSETIGLGNSTGNSTGDHLHLEIKYKGSFIDPLSVL